MEGFHLYSCPRYSHRHQALSLNTWTPISQPTMLMLLLWLSTDKSIKVAWTALWHKVMSQQLLLLSSRATTHTAVTLQAKTRYPLHHQQGYASQPCPNNIQVPHIFVSLQVLDNHLISSYTTTLYHFYAAEKPEYVASFRVTTLHCSPGGLGFKLHISVEHAVLCILYFSVCLLPFLPQ